jgi:hypothetical protein
VAAINISMRAMLFGVIDPDAGLGVLVAVSRVAAEKTGGPSTVMRLQT